MGSYKVHCESLNPQQSFMVIPTSNYIYSLLLHVQYMLILFVKEARGCPLQFNYTGEGGVDMWLGGGELTQCKLNNIYSETNIFQPSVASNLWCSPIVFVFVVVVFFNQYCDVNCHLAQGIFVIC